MDLTEKYKRLEKKFHLLQEKDLRQVTNENNVTYGSAASVCKTLVDNVGLDKAEELLSEFQTANNIELVTSAYFEAEDLDKSSLPIPIKFTDIAELYPPAKDIECRLEIDSEFVNSVSRRDWIGLFEVGWRYLHSYLTFEWVSTTDLQDKHVMKIKFGARTLPAKPKDKEHVFCYVTRTGDVLGVSSPFLIRNPGISFTDPDTFLIEDDMLTSISSHGLPSMDLLSLKSVNSPEKSALVMCPSFQDMDSKHEFLVNLRDELTLDLERVKEKLKDREIEITDKENKIAELQSVISAKTKQQDTIEEEQNAMLKSVQREVVQVKLEKLDLQARNTELEKQCNIFSGTINRQAAEMQSLKNKEKKLEEDIKSLQEEMLQTTIRTTQDHQLIDKCSVLEREKTHLQEVLTGHQHDKLETERLFESSNREVAKLNALLSSKDKMIDKLRADKQEADGNRVTMQREVNKYKDDYKRLMSEMTSCINKLKEKETEVYNLKGKTRQLEAEKSELSVYRNENTVLKQQMGRLEAKTRDLEDYKISLGTDGDIANVTVLSLHARVAHLEHQNSQLQSHLSTLQLSRDEPIPEDLGHMAEEKKILERELEEKIRILSQTEHRSGEIERNFRDGIKDLRSQLVAKCLEIDQKNELLEDKREIIDQLRAECEEHREAARYSKHRLAQLEKKISEESDSYHQIISDLQTQLSGYTNAHIQFERNRLVKCPFCPAAYEQDMQAAMSAHIANKHP